MLEVVRVALFINVVVVGAPANDNIFEYTPAHNPVVAAPRLYVLFVDGIIDRAVVVPAIVKPVKVPSEVILVWAGVINVPYIDSIYDVLYQ